MRENLSLLRAYSYETIHDDVDEDLELYVESPLGTLANEKLNNELRDAARHDKSREFVPVSAWHRSITCKTFESMGRPEIEPNPAARELVLKGPIPNEYLSNKKRSK